ncbi:hypothetical protein XI08_00010 [Bradyrhizobium sp. CCBAU 11361]|nr:hypothetical protein [Bradyrhizobium sp. CCBAU 11361]
MIGLALDSYKHDPKLSCSPVPQEIADNLAKHGIVLDVDTVRKWLKQAAGRIVGITLQDIRDEDVLLRRSRLTRF